MEDRMHSTWKRLGLIALTAGVAVGGSLTAQARPAHAGNVTITVAYQQFGPPPYQDADWWKQVATQVHAKYPNITVKLLPVVADEGDYYTKIDLMMRSASTAPDIVREDSFLVGSDATAGYLAPLDSYLKGWSDYSQWYPSMRNITKFNGHTYGVMNGTDVRLIWYNKNLFKRAGLPTHWQPHSWAAILRAARTIKKKLPNVIPINLYSGIPMDEASTMQGFEMLLYGTHTPLYDYKTSKWIVSSKGFEQALNFVKTIYDPKNLLAPPSDIALSGQAGTIVSNQLLPNNKLAIDIDGSWLPGTWYPKGSHPWPAWQKVLGTAKMPTEFGQAPHYVTLSGGWSYSISARSAHKTEAWQVLQLANSRDLLAGYDVAVANIAPRKDEVQVPAYGNVPLNPFFTKLVGFTQFRPAFPVYPQVSNQIDLAMEQVMSGAETPAQAMQAYANAVTGIAGKSHVEKR
jgi:multiple sugar transport system substrate-binding protein